MRPRLSESDLEIIMKALDLYIADLERQTPAEEEERPYESIVEYMARLGPRYLLRRSLLADARNARAVKVQVLRNLKGMRGRTNEPYAYLFGRSKDPLLKWKKAL